MNKLKHLQNQWWWEIPFQIGLHLVVFLFYSLNTNGHQSLTHPQIKEYQVVFFLNYAIAVALIDYYLFPKYLYEKRYLGFFVLLAVLIVNVIFVEELILEQIYFPNFRGKSFGKWMFNLLDVMPVIMILSGFKLAWDLVRKQRQVESLRATVQESELKFLKSQINPHFLFNNLNNLYAYALENSPRTPVIILEMSSVLRYMLYECSQEYVPLSREVTQLENYIRLYEMQLEGRGTVSLSVSGVHEGGLRIAPLILMVFVENAFKHVAEDEADQVWISVALEVAGDVVHFRCENSAEPYGLAAAENQGIGLENVKRRLDYLYLGRYELEITHSGRVFGVDLRMDLCEKP